MTRGWGWRLLGTGRGVVSAAATATVGTFSSSSSPSSPTAVVGANDGVPGYSGGRRGSGVAHDAAAATAAASDDAAVTGAVAVEFSAKECLMAVALVDGTVLLTRVERYTSGVRCVCATGGGGGGIGGAGGRGVET